MQFLSIGVNRSEENIIESIVREFERLSKADITFSVDEMAIEGFTYIVCKINENKNNNQDTQTYKALKASVAIALVDYIICEYEEKLMSRIINTNYCYFNNVEKKEILNLASRIIRNDDKNFLNSLFQIRRRNIISKRLLEYLDTSNVLILDGFVNFRLKDYIKDLEEIVDKAVNEFLTDREYKEFIRLLRYFVEGQEPKLEEIHVVLGFGDEYELLDGNKKEITNECIEEFVQEISEGEINYGDLLVSSLITLAPKKITIHRQGRYKNKELLETIKSVFQGKIEVCAGCKSCKVSVELSEK